MRNDHALGLPGSPGVTATLVALVPRILAATLILIVCWLAANFLGQAVLIAAVNAGFLEARLLSRGVRWAVMLFTAATTLTQLGIGTQMVMVTFGVTFGGIVFALALAFLARGDRAEAQRRFELFVTQTRSAKKQYLDRAREHIRELKGGHAAR